MSIQSSPSKPIFYFQGKPYNDFRRSDSMVDPAHFVNLNYILLLNKYLISVTELKCTMLLKKFIQKP